MTESKPSELLFVRSILPHCKRIGPLWMKNVTNLRQKYREQSADSQQKQDELFVKLDVKSAKQLNEEINIVVNLLKKLYKEIQPHCIMNLIKCWLNFPEAKEDNFCIFTKGDCRGRMKRIDGGKGADKVWRLDTLVGIMYHGLPLTSADSNMIYHTCQHDLCIRPQHLRFKAASVSLVLVLKALEQTGYSIKLNSLDKDCCDEFVDIAGPFNIIELESLRHELVQATQMSSYKLACSADDIFILEQNPGLKKFYMKNSPCESPVEPQTVAKVDQIKQLLITKLSESSKLASYESFSSDELKFADKPENHISLSECRDMEPNTHNNLKRKSNSDFNSDFSCDSKRRRSPDIKLEVIQADDIEEKEIIEIMETKNKISRKSKLELMNCFFTNISDSPFKLNYDSFIRVTTRTESASTLESIEKKRSSQISVCCYSQFRRNSEDSSRLDENRVTNEFLDMIHSMRYQCKPASSLKMTPNIFSPVSGEMQSPVDKLMTVLFRD